MARKSVADRRQEIIDATLAAIGRDGLPAVRTQQLASTLGISTSLIFYHFGTLEHLIAAAFQHAAEHDLRRLASARARRGTALQRLRRVLALYGPTGPAEGWRLWIEGWAASLRNPGLRQVTEQLDLRWRTAVTELVAEGVAVGEFRCADPRAAAWRITALLDGLAVQLVARDATLRKEEVTAWVEDAVTRELGLQGV
jgi:AcrR family transcriptional regulator